jgi:hypothetical protein
MQSTIEPPPNGPPAFPHPGTRFELIDQPSPARGGLLAVVSPRSRALLTSALCLVALGVVAIVYFASMTDNLSVEGDNAIYIILAKAMAAGHGYTNIQGSVPRIEAQYPFLFPLLLVPIVQLFGVGGTLQMQALVTVFALGSFVLGFFVFRRWLNSSLLALAVVLGTAESDLVWEFAHKILTELPYLFFTLVACYFTTRYATQPRWRTWAGLFAVLAAGAAFLTRTIGISVCAAIPVYLLCAPPIALRGGVWKPRIQKALVVSAGLIVIAGGWTLRNRIVYSGQGHNYIGQFFLKQTYVPDAGSVSTAGLWDRIVSNAEYYRDQYQRMIAGHFWDHIPTSLHVSEVLVGITVIGFLYAVATRRTVAEFYVLGYVFVVLLWPWQDLRFAVPLMPFLFYYVATALILPMRLGMPSNIAGARLAAALVLLPLTVPTGVHTLHIAQHDRSVGYHFQSDKLGEWEGYSDWRDFHAAAVWLQAHAKPGSTVINRSPNILYLWTGLASRNYPYSLDTYSVMKDVSQEKSDYLLYDNFTWTYTTALYVKPVIARFPQRFVPVARFHGTIVYEVR